MPTTLRWELYPIPKGPRERQRYGGSYFEEPDWWTKPRSGGHQGELMFMAKEVLFLRSVWDGFRALWLWSWLLHCGLYLYVGSAILGLFSLLKEPGQFSGPAAFGYLLACAMGLTGSLGLLVLRLWHPRLRDYTTRTSMVNLLLLASIFASGIASFITAANVSNVLAVSVQPGLLRVHVFLVALFLAYFPFTHMTHAYMKFFTWHKVRWDDSPAIDDPHAAQSLATNLRRKVAWAAPHIAGDKPSDWSEVVADSNGKGSGQA